MTPIELPRFAQPQAEGWAAALDVFNRLPTGWCLVGGQMVQLHCAERAFAPIRPTDDLDAVLDVRARPHVLREFTEILVDLGFTSAGESWEGHQQRWVRGRATIDVLIPRYLGENAANRRGIFGGTTLETRGARSVLDAAEVVHVVLDGRRGSVIRPRLTAAIVAKAAAYGVTNDRNRRRHLLDVVVLSLLVSTRDDFSADLDRKGYRRLNAALHAIVADRSIIGSIPDAQFGLSRLAIAISGSPHCARNGGSEPLPPMFD